MATADGSGERPDPPATTGSRAHLRRAGELLGTLPVGVIEFDLTGRAVIVNERWRELTGCELPTPISPDDAIGLIHPDDRDAALAQWSAAIEDPAPFEFLNRFLHSDGKARLLQGHVSPLNSDADELVGFVAVVVDVTATIDESAPASALHYRQLLAQAPVGVIVAALDGELIEANSAFADLLGTTPNDLIGTFPWDFFHPDDLPRLMKDFTELADGSRDFYENEVRAVRRDGRAIWVAGGASLVRDGAGDPSFIQIVAYDVTGRHRDAEALKKSEERHRTVVAALHEGVIIFAHDGSIEAANLAAANLLGLEGDPDQRSGNIDFSRGWSFVSEDGTDLRLDELPPRLTLTEGAEVSGFRLGVDRPDHDRLWLEINTRPLSDDGPAARRRAVVSMRDISAEKEAADHLTQSEHRYRALVDTAPVGQLVADLDGSVEQVNAAYAKLMGAEVDILLDQAPWDVIHPDDLHDMGTLLGQLFAGEIDSFDREYRLVRANGETAWVSGPVSLLRDLDGEATHIHAFVQDITKRKTAEEALRLSEERYRSLVEAAPIGQLLADLEGRTLEANQALAEILSVSPSDLVGLGVELLAHPDDLDQVVALTAGLLEDETQSFNFEGRMVRPGDGSTLWVKTSTTLLRTAGGEPLYYLTLIEDITERREAEESARRLARIVESTSDIVGTIDPATCQLLYLNRAGRDLFGLVDTDVTSMDVRDLYTPTSAEALEAEVAAVVDQGENWTGELDMRRSDGSIIHVLQSLAADVDVDGSSHQVSFVGRDITEKRRREIDLAHQATHDPLTDLPNRALLLQLVDRALGVAKREETIVALLFLDLDRFKAVNDNLGHDAGDELLRQVSSRITRVLRPSDSVARLGGDEFVVLCEDVRDEHQAVAITQRITSAIEAKAFAVGGATLPVTASVGIALSADHRAHAESLLRDADAAMYRAKDRGRARHELFDEQMRRRSAKRLELADELAEAIERGQITVHYQPIIDLRTGTVDGVEALARWEHPSRGLLGPAEFIGLAEETGLIVGLGLSVLSKSCDQARRWEIEFGSRAPKVHVNLSARQLTHSNLPRLVQGVIAQSLIDSGRLCLEVTESVLMDDAATSIKALEELKAIGVELAIDDFGTGYSSLAYLRRFPVDVLKIDQSFVDGLGPDPDDSAIVSAIVNLGHTLDLTCVAEGVETTQQLIGLQNLGCHKAQGFYFARPEPAAAISRHLGRRFDLG